jgi:hypothetical protein
VSFRFINHLNAKTIRCNGEKTMVNPVINYIHNALMGIAFVVCAVSAFLPRGTWSRIHAQSGIVLIALVLLHLILHYKWIIIMTKKYILRR